MTVPYDLYDPLARACGEPFADSYLSGAVLNDGRLLPRTRTAWSRLTESWPAMKVLRDLKIALVKPPSYNAPNERIMSRAA